MENKTINSIGERLARPTPRFFKRLRNIGLIVGTIATGLIVAPVALPALLISVATYAATAAGIAVSVSQLTVKNEKD